MEYILCGITTSEICLSLASILNTTPEKIQEFVKLQYFRVRSQGIRWDYDNLELDHILTYFDITPREIVMDSITISHVAAILDKETFFMHGLLSLKSLFSTENTVSSFLLGYGISFEMNSEGNLKILVNGKPKSTDYLDHRIARDRCINGFLFGDDPEADDNVSYMRYCPEIVGHMGRELLQSPTLEREWAERSKAEEDLETLIEQLKKVIDDLRLVFKFSTGNGSCDLKGGILEIRRLKNAHMDLYLDLHHVGIIEFSRGNKKGDKIHVLVRNTVNAVIADFVEYKQTNSVGIESIGANCYSYEFLG
jgi:hypothetical protein